LARVGRDNSLPYFLDGESLMNDVVYTEYLADAVVAWDLTQLRKPKLGEPILVEGMNLKLSEAARIPGFGIYAMAYREESGERRLVYIGSYGGTNGRKGARDDAFGGNAAGRWYKHVASATSRFSKLACDNPAQYRAHVARASEFYGGDAEFEHARRGSFLAIAADRVSRFFRKEGFQTSSNRMGFAIQNLKTLHRGSLDDRAAVEAALSRFSFFYWRIEADQPVKKSVASKALVDLELAIIRRNRERLPMNKEYKRPASMTAHYHYDPAILIEVGSQAFRELSGQIEAALQALPLDGSTDAGRSVQKPSGSAGLHREFSID
jgi:predicted RNA-binding protein